MDRDRYSRIGHGDLPWWNPIDGADFDGLIAQALLPAGARVLDVGCGNGNLLRRALAGAAQGAARDTDPAAREMAARFEAAHLRGDTVHQREEARFALAVERDPARALRLAQQNWMIQREPADARILMEAAVAAGAPRAAAPALSWLADTGCQWPRLSALAASLGRVQ